MAFTAFYLSFTEHALPVQPAGNCLYAGFHIRALYFAVVLSPDVESPCWNFHFCFRVEPELTVSQQSVYLAFPVCQVS